MEQITEVQFRVKVQTEKTTETHNQLVQDWYRCKKDLSWLKLDITYETIETIRSTSYIINSRRHSSSSVVLDVDSKAIVIELTEIFPRTTKVIPFDTEGWELYKTKIMRETPIRQRKVKQSRVDDDEEDW